MTRMSEIRVVTFNIWNRSGPWDERFIAIKTGLARLEPDLVGLQEVIVTEHGDKLDQGKAIAESLGFHMVFGSSHGEGYSFGNAVLSRWPILRHEVFPLPALDDTEPRTLLYAEVDAPAGKIPFFVTHLAWRLHEGHVRQAQVVAIAERVAALCPPHGFPPVLVGDFNAEPESDEIRFLRGHTSLGRKCVYFADAFRVAGVVDRAQHLEFAFGAVTSANILKNEYVAIRHHVGIAEELAAEAPVWCGNAVGCARKQDR